MAKNLSAVDAYPIETGMRKDIAVELDVNERYSMQWLNEHVIPSGETFKKKKNQLKKGFRNAP